MRQPQPISVAEHRTRLLRVKRLARVCSGRIALSSEEVLASLVGSLLVQAPIDRHNLLLKAVVEVLNVGVPPDKAEDLVIELRSILEQLL